MFPSNETGSRIRKFLRELSLPFVRLTWYPFDTHSPGREHVANKTEVIRTTRAIHSRVHCLVQFVHAIIFELLCLSVKPSSPTVETTFSQKT